MFSRATDLDYRISIAAKEEQIARCYTIFRQLRPHLERVTFVERIRRQQSQGYLLATLGAERIVRAAAGYRILENLIYGKFMYVDDLVTDQADRSKGFGQALFGWLVEEANRLECDYLVLDSGVNNYGAHRFYLRNRMDITAHRFSLKLTH